MWILHQCTDVECYLIITRSVQRGAKRSLHLVIINYLTLNIPRRGLRSLSDVSFVGLETGELSSSHLPYAMSHDWTNPPTEMAKHKLFPDLFQMKIANIVTAL
jgi:hypothetical protein